MKSSLWVSILLLAAMPASAQNKVPSYSVKFDLGYGCNFIYGNDDGPDIVGQSSCDSPSPAYFTPSGGLVWMGPTFYPYGYAMTTRSNNNNDGTYTLDGADFSGPIVPYSVAGNWVVGGATYIYHSGTFFDPTGGVKTGWVKVVTNPRGDAFVLGYADAGFPTKKALQPTGKGPVLAEFSGANQSLLYATYLNALGFNNLRMMVRDKGGNIYLAQNGANGLGILVKLSASLPQKVLYKKNLAYPISALAVDAYQQVYLVSGASGVPMVNAAIATPGGPSDTSIVVLSPKADRIVYSSYLGGNTDIPSGVGVDANGNVVLGGIESDYVWDGRYPCTDGTANCSEGTYFANFGPLLRSHAPASLNFGKRTVGTTTVLALPLKNTGNIPISVAGTTLAGSAFTLLNTCAGALNPDVTCALKVAFHPTSTGAVTGSVVISSNSADSPQAVKVSGIGK